MASVRMRAAATRRASLGGARRLRALASWIVLALCCHALAATTGDADRLAGRPLLAALKAGGLILYFRHASTDFGQNDEQMTGYEDCTRQRNLTARGRDEARAIGAAIARLGLPIGEVLASPFCRTMETARLIFGRATAAAAVRGGPPSGGATERYAALRELLSSPPPAGTDLVIVSHGNPFHAVAGEVYLAEGEAAVIQPLGAAGFRIVARIPKDGWEALGTA
ncbi:MAG TPA: histidine phosphatase family protein [Casimicrobiaceae bacterium]|jgi:phosphohistidine phosphatase SixA|nr:histidine phosphatase family protein [Casimicrobiaceae bacterium]